MKKVVSSRGKIWIDQVPDPICNKKHILVNNIASVISLGTEKDSIEVRKKSPITTIRERPDLKRKAMKLISSAGFFKAYKIGMERLREPISLGYSSAGIVLETDEKIKNIKVGDHVSCMGYGANHAEFVIVTENLCHKLPENVSFKEGGFGTLGAIAMQCVRRANVSVGENIAVIGLGLIGNLTVQILKASGCTVVGFDLNDFKIEKSKNCCDGAYNSKKIDINSIKEKFTNGHGFDKAIITAGANTNDPIIFALELIRKKGKVILVGRTPIEIPREPFYEKEADFLISTSYGPGRYDLEFEEKGKYMPLEYIRWNEKENLASFLKLISERKIDVNSLISKEFSIEEADKAYEMLDRNDVFGLVINYAEKINTDNTVLRLENISKNKINKNTINVGIIGIGSFARASHLPNLNKLDGYNITGLCSNSGHKVKKIGEKYNVDYVTSDYNKILNDENIDLVLICTRHDTHAEIAIESLRKNKHTFVEKPLAIRESDIDKIIEYAKNSKGQLFVGFNRRFAPFTKIIKNDIINNPGNKIMNYYIRTDDLPLNHWALDSDIGGGRIIGEMVHFIDYLNFVLNEEVEDISAYQVDRNNDKINTVDDVSVTLKYKDGSIGNLVYSSIGSKEYPKETVYLHTGSTSYVLEDFKTLYTYSNKVKRNKLRRKNKGHLNELKEVKNALISQKELFDLNNLYSTHKIAFDILNKIHNPV
jgi:predicted dehydrogenase/NADPH:quinone reductase-like Zn-dependent oxidoreductase